MKKTLLSWLFLLAAATAAWAAPPKPKKPVVIDSAAVYRAAIDSVNGTFHYQQGHVLLPGGVGELTVPRGFRYLDSAQAARVMHKFWHNPPQESLGMLFPTNYGPSATTTGPTSSSSTRWASSRTMMPTTSTTTTCWRK